MAKSKKLTPRRMGREWALQFLYQIDLRQTDFDESDLKLFWTQLKTSQNVKERDFNKASDFASELILGLSPLIADMDALLTRYSSNWPLDRMPAVDRNLLRIGAYELTQLDTPAEIIINEAIEIGKAFGDKDSGKFINAILDQIHKSKSE